MTNGLKRTIVTMAMAISICVWSLFAAEAQAGSLADAQTSSVQAEESGDILTVYEENELQKFKDQAKALRAQAERDYMNAYSSTWSLKKVFTPKHAPVAVVSAELDKLKSERGRVVVIGNDIYVADYPDAVATMTQAFMRLDRSPKQQILIEARIVEASPSFVESLEIEWNTDGTTPSPEAPTLAFGFLNRTSTLLLNASINASETSAEARTIVAPRIMSVDGQEVSMRVFPNYWSSAAPVIEEPLKMGWLARETPARFVEPVLYVSGSSPSTAANVHFREVAAELKIKPNAEDNDRNIALDVKLTNDTPDSSVPAINIKEAETKLVLKDGETVIIGGVLVDGRLDSESHIPGRRGLPIMDWVLNGRPNEGPRSEILIFITANILPVGI